MPELLGDLEACTGLIVQDELEVAFSCIVQICSEPVVSCGAAAFSLDAPFTRDAVFDSLESWQLSAIYQDGVGQPATDLL